MDHKIISEVRKWEMASLPSRQVSEFTATSRYKEYFLPFVLCEFRSQIMEQKALQKAVESCAQLRQETSRRVPSSTAATEKNEQDGDTRKGIVPDGNAARPKDSPTYAAMMFLELLTRRDVFHFGKFLIRKEVEGGQSKVKERDKMEKVDRASTRKFSESDFIVIYEDEEEKKAVYTLIFGIVDRRAKTKKGVEVSVRFCFRSSSVGFMTHQTIHLSLFQSLSLSLSLTEAIP